ncbi:MAG: hypothetical protein ACFNVH_09205 [Segatella maculosa]
MIDFFDCKRFMRYLGKLWTEQRRTMFLSAAILLGIMFIIEVWICLTAYNYLYGYGDYVRISDPARTGISFSCSLLFVAGGCIAASRLFTDGQQKAGRIHVLTMPVSMFENWLARIVLFVGGYVLVFHIVFYALEICRVVLLISIYPNVDLTVQSLSSIIPFQDNPLRDVLYIFVWNVYPISLFVLGSMIFPRKPLLGTTISVFILGLIAMFILVFFSSFSGALIDTLILWAAFLSIANLWLSYRRMCELEVIDRM